MAEITTKQLRARASLSLRNSDFDTALAAYGTLAEREPRNPTWPQRRAEIARLLARHDEALTGFERALEIALAEAEILGAIAICKQILELDPGHLEALERLKSLYAEPAGPSAMSAATPQPTDAKAPWEPGGRIEPPLEDSPLEEVLLTETLPGHSTQTALRPEQSGIVEIPLVEASAPPPAKRGDAMAIAREQLLATPLFGALDPASFRHVLEHVELVSLHEGEVLFRQGDPADTLYIVADGAVVPIAEEKPRKKLAVLEAGSFFGEIGLLADLPRNATLEALVDSRLLALDRKAMWRILKSNRSVLQVMLRFLRDRLIDRLIRTSELFASIPAQEREKAARLFKLLEVKRGRTLIEQGRPSPGLYALLAGRAEVIQMDVASDHVLAELGPGEFFGEMSMLAKIPARSSVMTKSKCWVLSLDREGLDRLLATNPEVGEIVRRLACERQTANLGRGRGGFEPGGTFDP